MFDYQSVLKANPNGVLATADGGKVATRVFQYLFSDGNKVYLCFRKKLVCDVCGRKFHHTSNGKPPNKHRAWICGGRDKRTGANCTNLGIPEPTLMKAAAEVLGLEEFNSDVFSEQIESVIVREGRRLTFVFKDGHEVDAQWERRKTVPYSTIGFEKRVGRNICYSKCGKGNMSERRRKKLEKQKEAELNAECASNTGEEA
ncbi:MAG: recombinase zinc beta ribbon domain-containing protein [Oscillospiraceae bacterium]|nr:recombinase zinc beta ribbon domain-containing protein [Oscillospiraceae bacterium]